MNIKYSRGFTASVCVSEKKKKLSSYFGAVIR